MYLTPLLLYIYPCPKILSLYVVIFFAKECDSHVFSDPLVPSAFKHLEMLEANPSGNFTSRKKSQKAFFWSLDKVYRASGI
jgi:hypothetical protein